MAFREFTGELDEVLPSGQVQEFTGELDEPAGQAQAAIPEPTMGQVAQNAAMKGIAGNLENAYTMAANSFLGQIITRGLEAIQGDERLTKRADMKGMATEAGVIKPEHEPQTGPQRVVDMAIQGAVASASVPGPGIAGTMRGIATGAVAGGAGQTVREVMRPIAGETVSNLLGIATGLVVPMVPLAKPIFRVLKPAPQSPLNTKTRMQTLEDGQELGLVVQPTSVRPSAVNQLRESVAGPGKLNIAATIQNQRAATDAVKRQLGLPDDAELTEPFFRALKQKAGQAYREVEQLSGGKNLLEQVQQKRSDASGLWRSYLGMDKPSPEIRKAALEAEQTVSRLEDSIDQLAKNSGVPNLLNRVRASRQAFAQIYDVEAATNVGDGHISLPFLGRMLDSGKPLSGNLEKLAKFWNAFKPVAREGSSVSTVASGVDAASAATLGTIGGAASGNIAGTLAGLLPGLRGAARRSALSPEVQRSLRDMGSMRGIGVPIGRAATRGVLIGGRIADESEKE